MQGGPNNTRSAIILVDSTLSKYYDKGYKNNKGNPIKNKGINLKKINKIY